MTALGEFSSKAENTAGHRKENNQEAPARRFLPGAIKQLFRELKIALTRREEPAPEVKRERRDRTTRAFHMAAGKLVRRKIRLPEAAYATLAFVSETLDWLNPWHHAAGASEFQDDLQRDPEDHLSLHL